MRVIPIIAMVSFLLLASCGKEDLVVVPCLDTVVTAKVKAGAEPAYVRAVLEFSCKNLERK